MSEKNVGGIFWTVDADTSPAIDSTKSFGDTVDKTEEKLKGLDAQTKKSEVRLAKLGRVTAIYTAKLKKNGSSIAANGVVLDKYGRVNEHATNRLQKLTNAQAKLTGTSAGVKKALDAQNKALAANSRKFGQAGIQAQQFFGQLQGGQGFLVAASAQFADLGIVLGLPLIGAIGGIAFSLANILMPALLGGKTQLELLEKATLNVKAAMTLGADGVIEYTAEMKKLKQISEALTEIKLANLISEQAAAFKVGIKGISKLISDAGTDFVSGQLFDMKTISAEGRLAFKTLNESAKELKLKPTIENLNKVEKALLGLSRAGVDSKKAGRELTNSLGGLIAEYKLGQLSIESLQEALKDTNVVTGESVKETKKHKDEVKSMVEALQMQAEMLGMSDRQMAQYAASRANATQADKEAISAAFDLIEAEDAKIQKAKEVDAILKRIEKEDQARANKKTGDRNKAIGVATGVVKSGLSPIERLEAENEKLLELKAKYVDDSAIFDEALTVNANKQADLRSAYQIANANLIMSSSASLFGNLASLLKSSGSEQSNAYKAMFALSKGFAIAQAAMNLSLAISNASAITPWYASLPAVASVVSAGAGLASSIAGASYSGREHGGSVIGGQTYEVGEKNKPEMLMIPGNNGKVFSNSEMKSFGGGGNGGGGAPIINIYGAPANTQVESRQDPLTKQQVTDIVIGQMTNPNSQGRRGQQSNSNLHNKLNGTRRTQ
jgi:hypothetical protein